MTELTSPAVVVAERLPRVRTELPGPRSRALLERKDRVINGALRDWSGVPLVEARRTGYVIEDVDGNTFADHVSAWGAAPYGSHPPHVRGAVNDAWDRYGMEISNYIQSEPVIELAERLVALAPGRISRVAPTVTGTEAVEGAVKLAREATGRPMILTFLGQYHGESTYLAAANSTDTSMCTTANAQYVPGLVYAPYPNSFRAPFHRGAGPFDDTLYLDFIEQWLLRLQVEPTQIAGVLIEPVAGEAGILAPSAQFWAGLTALCRRYGWLLILDEVQTCLGRCGTVFAADLWGLEPDILLLGKGLTAGGQAIAAIMATEEVLADSHTHLGGTYAWEPAACAGALAGLDLLAGGDVLDNVAALDAIAREELIPLLQKYEQLGDVRPLGAWVALEFVTDRATISPASAFQAAVHQAALRRGVLAISEDSKPLYRMQPALTMPPELFRWSCQQVADAIAEVAAAPPEETDL
ncbi:MAG: aminotransferase class III-fold pyridoxal phosphate-dependent enzyme [Candidatus Nanopelagicales bacterium]